MRRQALGPLTLFTLALSSLALSSLVGEFAAFDSSEKPELSRLLGGRVAQAAADKIVQVVDFRRRSVVRGASDVQDPAATSSSGRAGNGSAVTAGNGAGGNGAGSNGGASVLTLKPHVYGEVVPVPADLLQNIAWTSPWSSQSGCGSLQATVHDRWKDALKGPLDTADNAIQSLLTEASDQLLRVELEAVRKALKDTRLLLPCARTVLTRESLRSLFVLEAVAMASAGDPKADAAFRQLMAIDPRLFLEPEHPPKVRKQYMAVAQALLKEAPTVLDLTGLDGELYLDGRLVSRQAELLSGLHLLQMKGPAGQVRSAAFLLEGKVKERVSVASLVDIGLPPAEKVQSVLEQSLKANTLESSLRAGLDAYLKTAGLQALAMVVEGEDHRPGLRYYREGQGLVSLDAVLNLLAPGQEALIPASGFAVGVEAHVGTGLTAAQDEILPNVTGLLGLQAQLKALRLGGNVSSQLDLTRVGVFPSLTGQVLLGAAIPLLPVVSLVPMVGYAAGTGPAIPLTDCGLAADAETISCGAGAGSSTVWMKSFSHGPSARLLLQFDGKRAGRRRPVAATVGIQGFYSLSSTLVPSAVTLEDGTRLEVSVDPSVKPSPLRLEGMGGFLMMF